MDYLEARNGRFFFRLRLDPLLADACGRRTVRYTLGSASRREARLLASVMLSNISAIRESLAAGLIDRATAACELGNRLRAVRGDAAPAPARTPQAPGRRSARSPTRLATAATIAHAVAAFVAEKRPALRARTLEEYRVIGRRLEAAFGSDFPVCAIDRSKVVELRDTWAAEPPNMAKGVRTGRIAPATLEKRITRFGTFMAWCVEQGLVDRNPVARLPLPPRPAESSRRGFTDAEATTILDALGDRPAEQMITLLAMHTGCRLAELTGLRRTDIVDGNDGLMLRIQPHKGRALKTSSSQRIVPLTPAIEMALRGWLESTNGDLVVDLDPDQFSKRFGRLLRRLGMPRELVFHSWRHGVAERLRAAGTSAEIIAAILGHTDGSVTGRYAKRHADGELREALRRLSWPECRWTPRGANDCSIRDSLRRDPGTFTIAE